MGFLKKIAAEFIRKPLVTRPFRYGWPVWVPLKTDLPGLGALIHELVLETCPGPKLFKGYGLWTAFVYKNIAVNIRRKCKSTLPEHKQAKRLAIQEVNSLTPQDLSLFKTVWENNLGGTPESFWKRQNILHAYFSESLKVDNYVLKTGKLMAEYLGGGRLDIPSVMRRLNYKPGFFYDAQTLRDDLARNSDTVIYPSFEMEDGIPCVHYLVVAVDFNWKKIDHPSACLITSGNVLFRRQ